MPLQSPPKTIVVVGPEHPQGLRWREAMRERGALLAHTERVPQALDWLSRLAPDWLISVTPLPAPPHCRQLTWSGTQEELESLLHDIAPPPSASETLVLGELEIDPQQGRLSVQGRGSVHLPATEFRLLAQAQVVKIDGSSTVYPITEGVAEDFQKSKKNAIKVTVGISGTGGGFKKFCRGETDISNASRPILEKEMADCKRGRRRVHRAAGRLRRADRRHQPARTPSSSNHRGRTEEDVGAGGAGQDHALEPGQPGLARRADQAVRRRRRLGTFDYFTEAIVGKSKASRGDFTASEDDNVLVQGVAQDVNAIGYFGYAYYAENQSS
jgi:hypothetical protein